MSYICLLKTITCAAALRERAYLNVASSYGIPLPRGRNEIFLSSSCIILNHGAAAAEEIERSEILQVPNTICYARYAGICMVRNVRVVIPLLETH